MRFDALSSLCASPRCGRGTAARAAVELVRGGVPHLGDKAFGRGRARHRRAAPRTRPRRERVTVGSMARPGELRERGAAEDLASERQVISSRTRHSPAATAADTGAGHLERARVAGRVIARRVLKARAPCSPRSRKDAGYLDTIRDASSASPARLPISGLGIEAVVPDALVGEVWRSRAHGGAVFAPIGACGRGACAHAPCAMTAWASIARRRDRRILPTGGSRAAGGRAELVRRAAGREDRPATHVPRVLAQRSIPGTPPCARLETGVRAIDTL